MTETNKRKFGHIYMFTSPDKFSYVGSTIYENPMDRIKTHKKDLKRHVLILDKKHKGEKLTHNESIFSSCKYFYNKANTFPNGLDDFKFQVLKSFADIPYKDLLIEEDKMIIENKTLDPHGLNLKLNTKIINSLQDRPINYFTDSTRKILSEKATKSKPRMMQYVRKHTEELDGFEIGIRYYKGIDYNYYQIKYHPSVELNKSKYFSSKTKTWQELKLEVIAFLNEFYKKNPNYVKRMPNNEEPEYKSKYMFDKFKHKEFNFSEKLNDWIKPHMVNYYKVKFFITTKKTIANKVIKNSEHKIVNLMYAYNYCFEKQLENNMMIKDNSSETSNQLGLMIYIDIKCNIFTYINVPSDLKV